MIRQQTDDHIDLKLSTSNGRVFVPLVSCLRIKATTTKGDKQILHSSQGDHASGLMAQLAPLERTRVV